MTQTANELELARLPETGQLELAFKLPEGTLDVNGLALGAVQITYEEWEQVGHYIGRYNRWSRFALGDWLNWGEEAFAESDQWAQATEATPQERYDVGNRVTGLKVETLRNYASVCKRIPIGIRRIELGFSEHEPVAALDPDDQAAWLAKAVENGWDRSALRDAIREAKSPPAEDEPDGTVTILPPPLSRFERIEQAASLVFHQSQPTSEGGALVPPEAWAQLTAALGEES